ncbi:hypothetical protein BgiMline_021950 [Biomphalaria glabrata]|uniref:Uncharacterized protein LOC106053613 n=2 Tax=Biomphalaria TaxID=6525 RepID=A0A2C9LCQ3_BIOGL|nr:uncharacterized protein LOC106053613 [Biomphalaria glabrata]KAI8734279.1 hypothetical protein BgiMline_028506 [Biomphalaria glabrata]KAI8797715.1 hypothetical protein BgiBS90_000018 [Biomphalaria glabrata]KAK0060708.1 hypothetical protein Bpfe_009896 [Biomphalaria pfeifferi]
MRFKQTKPQHVKKKDEARQAGGTVATLVQQPSIEDWEGYDCVDGDVGHMNAADDRDDRDHRSQFTRHLTESPQNGDTVMDMGPMLELYTHDECNGSSTSPEQLLDDPPTPAVAENDVIIQGRRPIFSESEESNIASQLKQWKEQGMKYTRLDVVKMASEYAVHLGKRPQGRPLTVKWFRSFLTRHPECYIRKSRKTKNERPEKQHFNQLDTILTTYNIKESPHCIFSLVELTLPMLKNGEVSMPEDLSLNGANGSSTNKKLCLQGKLPSSLLFCGSAAGQALPPFLIYLGKTLDKSVLSGATPGASGVASSTGRATSEVLVSFLREHFLSQAPGRSGDTLILLLDSNLGRCLNQSVIDLGSAFKVVFVTAQTSLNPQLHPMAVGCCNTFQRELCYELQKPLYSSESTAISSNSICEFLCRLYHRNMSAENLHTTFRKAGIFPFNPSICRKRYGSAVIRPANSTGSSAKYFNQVAGNLATVLKPYEDDDELDGNPADDDADFQ